jgi:hypothetical protein
MSGIRSTDEKLGNQRKIWIAQTVLSLEESDLAGE